MSFELATIIALALGSIIALYAALRGRKIFLGFALAFLIYTYFDIYHTFGWHLQIIKEGSEPIAIFVAAAALVWSVWEVYEG